MATLVAKRQLNELRKKNNHVRQMLAKVQFKYTPFPGVGGILFLMFPLCSQQRSKSTWGLPGSPGLLGRRMIMLGGLKD